MVCIPILTVFLRCPGQTSVQFCFPILKDGGMLSVCQWEALWSLRMNQINVNSLYYYLNEIGLV